MVFYYASLWLKKKYIMACGNTVVILLSASRIYLGVHYSLDIVGGFAAGTFLFWVVHAGVNRSQKNSLTLIGMLTFSWSGMV
ncbi:phosphatase PAP2 family protein [Fictibacillus iocasae]|uniref:Phosphatase PAP2 family protein n=1 Tax=Fictibacillus iocasae TaxID=2715437 RepID=A0ABW2NMR4_9BACL